MKTFYKARLIPEETGLIVWMDKYYSVKETPCFHFCVGELDKWRVDSSVLPIKKKMLKRIHKTSSRFAFDTEEQAIEHLRMMKRRQLRHMEREKDFIDSFLACKSLVPARLNERKIPNTRELVMKHLRFD